ncbi:MAG TPA: EI24 domain-containing protein [Pseudonocardiaceae bacterium]
MGDFVTGLRLFGRAAFLLIRSPRLLVIGVLPALITLVLFGAGFVVLVIHLDELTGLLTWFAAGWDGAARQAVRALAGIAVLVAAGMFAIVSYTAVTLLVGDPFYERLSRTVEARPVEDRFSASPHPADHEEPSRPATSGIRDSVLVVMASLACSVPLLAAGLLPVVGQTVVPVLGVSVGSWLLALELAGVPFRRRGLGLGELRRALRGRRLLTLGTAMPAYLLCAVPFTAVIAMPVAVVAATLLARELLDRPGSPPTGPH